jgi:hypothetical protein
MRTDWLQAFLIFSQTMNFTRAACLPAKLIPHSTQQAAASFRAAGPHW